MKKLRVLFDSQCFDMQRFGGVSRCFAELYRHLPEDIDATLAAKGTKNSYLRDVLYEQHRERYRFPGGALVGRLLCDVNFHSHSWRTLNRKESIRRLRQGDFDVFHATFFHPYFLPLLNGKPFVLTIHDMIAERLPEHYSAEHREEKRLLAERAAHIVAVSEFTKQDVIRLLGIPEEKVSVVYHGTSAPSVMPRTAAPHTRPYLLYVGTRENEYKKFRAFIEAALPALRRHPEIDILCTGEPFSADEQEFFTSLNISDRMKQQFAATDADLAAFYRDAIAFVYPSSLEGFGIPILEAWQAGCPVMLNRASCFPEIAGEAAVWFGFGDGQSVFDEQFERLYRWSDDERAAFLKKQRERLADFSWEKSASKLAAVYHRVAEEHKQQF